MIYVYWLKIKRHIFNDLLTIQKQLINKYFHLSKNNYQKKIRLLSSALKEIPILFQQNDFLSRLFSIAFINKDLELIDFLLSNFEIPEFNTKKKIFGELDPTHELYQTNFPLWLINQLFLDKFYILSLPSKEPPPINTEIINFVFQHKKIQPLLKKASNRDLLIAFAENYNIERINFYLLQSVYSTEHFTQTKTKI